MSRSFSIPSAVAALALLVPAVGSRPQVTTDFNVLDAVEGAWLNFPNFVVRGMALGPDGSDLYAVNQHDDTVVKFAAFSGGTPPGAPLTPVATYPAPWDPVSVAYWDGPSASPQDDELLVVGRGSWGVMGISVATGDVTRFLQLTPGTVLPGGVESRIGWMAEPADILVDDDSDTAFVSCSGADSVVQIDLSGPAPGEVVRVFHETVAEDDFRCKHPLFLSWDEDQGPGQLRKVIVTPLVSGNNSIWEATHNLVGGKIVLDLADPLVADELGGVQGLPDEDAFRITPFVADLPGQRGGVEPVARGMGTLLFAHGRNPKNGRFWQLNTEANNKDPELQSEPHLKGIFSFNRLTRIVLTTTLVEATQNDITSLDPYEMSGIPSPYDATTTLGQPFGLDFSPDGLGFVSGLLTDNVAVLSKTGQLVVEGDLAPLASDPSWTRTIPRSVLWKGNAPGTTRVGDFLVYCWGDNTIRQLQYDLTGAPSLAEVAVYDLGRDPMPDPLAHGRSLFFDGSNSAHGNLACASCHVEGGSDMLVWNLSNNPRGVTDPDIELIDSKGGMLTQTMTGLERVGPFHWRGERSLEDFNGAFEGLLGGEQLDPTELADFIAFVESLRNPANPNESRERKVDDTISFVQDLQSPVADAVTGQDEYHNDITLDGRFTCAACHMTPVGTNNDIVDEVPGTRQIRQSHRKPAPFHDLWRRQQSGVQIDLLSDGAGNPISSPYLGAAVNHVGNDVDLVGFVGRITGVGTDRTKNISAFIHQLDSGIAPAAHYGFYLDAGTHAVAQTELAYLVGQASSPLVGVEAQCDVVVYGTRWTGLGFEAHRWAFDRHTGTFLAEHSSVPARTLTDFLDGALQDGERTVFLGAPAGSGEALAIDADMDGVRDGEDSAPETPDIDPTDTTPPTFVRDPAVLWVTTRNARIRFETDEPSSVVIRYRRAVPGASWREVTSPPGVYGKVHSYLLNDLDPSTGSPAANPNIPPPAGMPSANGQNPWYAYEDAGFSAVDSTYDLEVEITDLAGNSPPVPYQESEAVRTTDFLEPQDPAFEPSNDGLARHHHMEHVLTSLEMDPLEEAGGWVTARVHADIAYRRGGDWVADDYVLPVAARRIVVGRALRKFSSTAVVNGTVQVVDRYEPLDPDPVESSAHIFEEIFVSPGGNSNKMALGGDQAGSRFLVSPGLSNQGQSVLEFAVASTALSPGDSVVFVVDGVFEVPNPGAWAAADKSGTSLVIPAALPTPWDSDNGKFGLSRWSFPATGEATSVVEQVYP